MAAGYKGFLNLLVLPVNCQGRLHISQDHGYQLPVSPPSYPVHLHTYHVALLPVLDAAHHHSWSSTPRRTRGEER